MAERPILFSGPMVRAILDGSKTVTRMVVKRPHIITEAECFDLADCWIDAEGAVWGVEDAPCPYGEPSDLLWVRETFAMDGWDDTPPSLVPRSCPGLLYKASEDPMYHADFRWRPSIHMPKWAARIWLRVTEVRVERVQDITEDDARAEGFRDSEHVDESFAGRKLGSFTLGAATVMHSALGNFQILWDELNERRGFSFDSNPWVWVVRFERTDAP